MAACREINLYSVDIYSCNRDNALSCYIKNDANRRHGTCEATTFCV